MRLKVSAIREGLCPPLSLYPSHLYLRSHDFSIFAISIPHPTSPPSSTTSRNQSARICSKSHAADTPGPPSPVSTNPSTDRPSPIPPPTRPFAPTPSTSSPSTPPLIPNSPPSSPATSCRPEPEKQYLFPHNSDL